MNIFIMATHYEGEPPDDAVEWWDWVEATKKTGLPAAKGNKFTVFALGDLTYKYYCQMGKNTDAAMEALGLERVYDIGTGSNDQNNIEEFFEEWKINLWNKITDHIPNNKSYDPNAVDTSAGAGNTKFNVETIDGGEESNIDTLDASTFDLNAGVSTPNFKSSIFNFDVEIRDWSLRKVIICQGIETEVY